MSFKGIRIVNKKSSHDAFSGEGARLYGGRWNSKGTRMVYVASSLSLATLELMVHVDDYSLIEDSYVYIPVVIPDDLVIKLQDDELPVGWDGKEPIASTQILGDTWASTEASAVLQVPSAVTAGEWNYLLNPLHLDFPKILQESAIVFSFDQRLSLEG